MEEKMICGTCKYHELDEDTMEDWICTNDRSEYHGDWTTYGITCQDWEPR